MNVAPWLNTKLTKPVANWLRNKGLTSVVYLDDWLCFGSSREDCAENVRLTRQCLESLGFLINEEKSKLTSSTRCQFLGFILDSKQMTLELTEQKREVILSLTRKYKNLEYCKIREFAQFVGNITGACPAVQYGWLYSKGFERQKYLALLRNKGDYEARMKLPSILNRNFDWWEAAIMKAANPIRLQKYALEIFSDASLTGWGAACNGETTHGEWCGSELKEHINYLELLAALFALQCFASSKQDCEILLRIDNTTAIAYINRMGGMKYPKLNSIARVIWQWCESRNLWITASYIASKDNVEADRGSRIINTDTEWELAPWAFDIVVQNFGDQILIFSHLEQILNVINIARGIEIPVLMK